MSIDHPHGGGEENITAKEWARKLSKSIPGETFILVRCRTKNDYVTSDTEEAHNNPDVVSLSYYLDGQQVQEGHELITGLF